MVVFNRIKIINNCSNLVEAEQKVNEFFTKSCDICELSGIQYYLEDGIIILEYITHKPECFKRHLKENIIREKIVKKLQAILK